MGALVAEQVLGDKICRSYHGVWSSGRMRASGARGPSSILGTPTRFVVLQCSYVDATHSRPY